MVHAANRDGHDTCTDITCTDICDTSTYNQVLAQTLQTCHESQRDDERRGERHRDRDTSDRDSTGAYIEVPWSAPHPQAGFHVFKDLEEMAQVWLHHGGDVLDLPAVNFNHSMVLAAFSGEGSFRESISITRLKHDAELIQAYVCAYTRPWSIRNAMSVIQVPRVELPIQFVPLF